MGVCIEDEECANKEENKLWIACLYAESCKVEDKFKACLKSEECMKNNINGGALSWFRGVVKSTGWTPATEEKFQKSKADRAAKAGTDTTPDATAGAATTR